MSQLPIAIPILRNEFGDCLKFSNDKEFIKKMDSEYYPKKFPKLKSIRHFNRDTFEDLEMQRNGIDVEIIKVNGKIIYTDEKRRKRWFRDILLEIGMDYEVSKISYGWLLAERKKPDYIIYIKPSVSQGLLFGPSENIYKLPFEPLQNIFREEFESLVQEYERYFYKNTPNYYKAKQWAKNKGLEVAPTEKDGRFWWTLNKPIEPDELFEMLKKESEDLIPSI